MANAIAKNLEVLKDQALDAWEAIELDIINAKSKWRHGDYLGALHTFIFGPPAEIFQHMHRWVFYGFIAWGVYSLVG